MKFILSFILLFSGDSFAGVGGASTITGGTDGTQIGNLSDLLKVNAAQGVQGSSVSPWYVNLRNAAGTEIGTSTTPINNNPKFGTGQPVINRTDVTLSAQSANGNSSSFTSDGFMVISATVNVTAISGTAPTFQVDLEASNDGTNWGALHSTRRFTATGTLGFPSTRFGGYYYRFKWFITGTTPSVTFNIVTTLKSGATGIYRTFVRYSDIDLTTNGNVSTSFSASGCSNVIFQGVRGADGGNNGSVRIDGSNNDIDYNELTGNLAFGVSSTNYTSTAPGGVGGPWNFYRARVAAATNAGTRVLNLFWSCSGG